jgi:outer membrane protein TolC
MRQNLSTALFAGLFWVIASGHVSAQEPAPLSLDALILQVATRSPGVAAEALRAEAMRRAIRRAGALDDPQLTVMAEDIPKTIRGGMPMVRLQANQMLPWPGKRERMTRVAEREAQVAGAKETLVLLDAVTQAKRIYYGLYLSMEARRVNREQRAIADTLVDVVTGRLASGMSMHHDVLKMQTEASMLDDDLAMLEAERREMAAMLNALRDLPPRSPWANPWRLGPPRSLSTARRSCPARLSRGPRSRKWSPWPRAGGRWQRLPGASITRTSCSGLFTTSGKAGRT